MSEPNEWQQRVINERDELINKIHKLSEFTKHENFSMIAEIQRELLTQQLRVMIEYREILQERLNVSRS